MKKTYDDWSQYKGAEVILIYPSGKEVICFVAGIDPAIGITLKDYKQTDRCCLNKEYYYDDEGNKFYDIEFNFFLNAIENGILFVEEFTSKTFWHVWEKKDIQDCAFEK
ncbi:MAG: hypothetical protein ACW99A_22575 [Candidatus Kariarchaeaceae archaeon]|jgi:hypothetical protein